MTGVVNQWYSSGWGWVTPDDGTQSVFVNARDVRRTRLSRDLSKGDRVEFDVVPGERGRHREAKNVVRLAAGVPT